MQMRLLLLLSVLMVPSVGIANDRPNQIEVNVTQANVHGLILIISDASRHDLAIGGYADQRLTLSATYPSYQEFLAGVTKVIGGTLSAHSSTAIITHACIGTGTSAAVSSSAEPTLGPTKISLNFARIDPVQIFNLIYGIDVLESSLRERFKPGNHGLVGLRLKDAPLSAIHQILSRTSGVEILTDGAGNLVAKGHSTCTSKNHESNEAPTLYMQGKNCQRNMPPLGDAKEAKEAKCEPLEFYKLENIVLRGYARSNGRTIALAETPDGITWAIASGDYLGKDFGKVMSVSTTGLTIRELAKNPYGYIYEQTIHVDYQNNRRPVLSN